MKPTKTLQKKRLVLAIQTVRQLDVRQLKHVAGGGSDTCTHCSDPHI